ncbi:hypothetical protein NIES4071_58850 [Calothrix sp. NIES-4071]|nr:hypothetical protein NIES4071_58850 [Calothrix sp. NIES-4071]BAZ60192.1 hypothetical protein NIES4105_58800 [Calothrix sp. NIES-4105]
MSIEIINGIQLPAYDVELLNSGELIAVPFKQYKREGEVFWLYPSQQIPFNLEIEQYYQAQHIVNARKAIARSARYPIEIKAWARCEYHWHVYSELRDYLYTIAQSSVWNLSALEHILEQHQVLKLLLLRVYRLSNPCIVNVRTAPGTFYWAKAEDLINMASENDTPVVSNVSFNKRKTILLSGKAYPNTGIEALLFQCEQILDKNSSAKQFSYDIQKFLGWIDEKPAKEVNPNLAWINDIAALGNRSKQEDEGKSNYQAGTDFENVVRNSLEFLGFTIDYYHKGGAGGLDLFCSKPYALVGECKAGKKIPNDTAVQLLNLATLRLQNQELFKQATKLIIGPGEATTQLEEAAKLHGMAIINPETLEKLVKLQHAYPNSIDLFKLKEYLEPGKSDESVEKYINQIYSEINLRAQLIQLVKKYINNTGSEQANVDEVHGFAVAASIKIKKQELHEILVELSSPLTGYLGRIKGEDWRYDKFYFLRDLLVS